MHHLYRVLASQYDTLGYILSYTTRAKIKNKKLSRIYGVRHGTGMIQIWLSWESELPALSTITLPCCLTSQSVNPSSATHDLHIFCDTSEQSYGAVANMLTEDHQQVYVSFLVGRSRIAPKNI